MKNYFGFTNASSFPLHEGQLFYWSIMKAVDSTKCRCTHSGRKGQVGGFQNPGVCLQAFPSFLLHPLPALLLVPFFARFLPLVPCSLLLNRTETLAKQATVSAECSVRPRGRGGGGVGTPMMTYTGRLRRKGIPFSDIKE